MSHNSSTDIDNILAILDNFGHSETSRMKINVSEEIARGTNKREYHLGRCDINSPWACGTPFDVLEEDK